MSNAEGRHTTQRQTGGLRRNTEQLTSTQAASGRDGDNDEGASGDGESDAVGRLRAGPWASGDTTIVVAKPACPMGAPPVARLQPRTGPVKGHHECG